MICCTQRRRGVCISDHHQCLRCAGAGNSLRRRAVAMVSQARPRSTQTGAQARRLSLKDIEPCLPISVNDRTAPNDSGGVAGPPGLEDWRGTPAKRRWTILGSAFEGGSFNDDRDASSRRTSSLNTLANQIQRMEAVEDVDRRYCCH